MLRLVGLLGTSALCWLAYLAFGASPRDDGFSWLWFVPLPYFAAWLTLTCQSPAAAVAAFALLVGANFAITAVGLAIGISTFGLLALPAILTGYFALGWALAFAEELNGSATARDRLWVHAPPLMASSLAVFASVWIPESGTAAISNRAASWTVTILTTGFSLHAFASWPLIADAPSHTHPTMRVAALFALAFALPVLFSAAETPISSALGWPFQVQQITSARVDDAARHHALWGKRTGVTLHAGARVETKFEGSVGWAVVPQGWVLRSEGGRDPMPTDSLTFRRDPKGESEGLVQQVHISDGRWRVLSAKPATASDTEDETTWRGFGCDPDPPTLDGLAACRRMRLTPWEKPSSGALTARLPEAALTERLVFTRETPLLQGDSFFVVAASFYAECEIARSCWATLRQGERTSVRVEFREAHLAAWRTIRAEVGTLLLAATGRDLSEGSPLKVRRGESPSSSAP